MLDYHVQSVSRCYQWTGLDENYWKELLVHIRHVHDNMEAFYLYHEIKLNEQSKIKYG